MTFPKIFTLKTRDYLKSLILAIGTPVLYFIQEAIPGYDLSPLVKIALAAGVTYLIKNFFTDVPPVIEIDPTKTLVVHEETKQALIEGQKSDIRNTDNLNK